MAHKGIGACLGQECFSEAILAPSLDATFALVPIAPFLAAFMAPFIHRFAGASAGWILAIVPASIFIYLVSYIGPVADHGLFSFRLNWLEGAVWQFDGGDVPVPPIPLSFFLDGLSLTFGLLISGIGTIIVIYSGAYLSGHKHQGRFLAFILMFMGSMLGLVFSDNMIVLFVFWELTSITSFLLIGFDHARQASRRAAIQALVVTGAGGLALLVGAILLQQMMGTWELTNIFPYGVSIVEEPTYLAIMILFCLAAFTKSAQFPFHFWLPNAMEAPTPVSAFLHSATMVKAGVYLLARMNPILGSTDVWSLTLVIFGSVTLLYGATIALRQTDMKQMLAQTTLASLGLLVLLIGVGTDVAISAAVIYLIAHALYKAALFLIAGIIDHETGTREITALGGLRGLMPITFIAAVLAAISMAGLPPAIGFFAKEEMYLGLASMQLSSLVVLVVLILGNAMMLVVGAAIAIKPFLGGLKSTPLKPHEAPLAMWAGPVIFGVLALAAGLMVEYFGHTFLVPAASAISNFEIESHLKLALKTFQDPLILLSVATWALGALLFWQLTSIRSFLRRVEEIINWNFDKGFDALMFGLIRFADAITRVWHHGRLELYLIVVFVAFAVALYLPLTLFGGVPGVFEMPQLNFYEWGIVAIAVLGLIGLVIARTRLVAIVSLGIQGFAVALIFMLFGAPDLSFTQFMVETLSVVILALVMTRLHLEQRDSRVLEEAIRDGALAIVCGVGVSLLLISILRVPLDTRLSDFFAQTSVAIAHGHNVVNVILVDYRGLDTLGEISVVMTAGIAILALIRIRAGGPRRRKASKTASTAPARQATRRTRAKTAGAKA
jgi:multicomponent Na+:H+ antiporter subunit A